MLKVIQLQLFNHMTYIYSIFSSYVSKYILNIVNMDRSLWSGQLKSSSEANKV